MLKKRKTVTSAAPTFNLALPSSGDAAAAPVKIQEPIKGVDAEQLIVNPSAGSLESPFIAMGGAAAFPGGPSTTITPAPPSALHRVTTPVTPVAPQPPSPDGDGMGAHGGMGRRKSRKFFRVDGSNLYVYVDGSLDTNSCDDLQGADVVQGNPASASAGIPFEDLVIGELLGTGSQGTVRAVTHTPLGADHPREYALKKISVSGALDRSQADVERQARKNAVVRELEMVAARSTRNEHMVQLHNAYFRRDSSEGHLHILMERMHSSAEDLTTLSQRLTPKALHGIAQRAFGNQFGGVKRIEKAPPVAAPWGPQSRQSRPSADKATAVAAQRARHHSVLADEVLDVQVTPLPEIIVSLVAHDVLQGLVHFHETLRFVHTDLKPPNIMLSRDMRAFKLADFGCSQVIPDRGPMAVNNALVGTKLYMSPERAEAHFGGGEGGTFDERSDVWALGIVVSELAAGYHPCHEFREEYWSFADCLQPGNMALPAQCSPALMDFLYTALTPDRTSRPSARALLKHEFIERYAKTNRGKLRTFVTAVERASRDADRTAMHDLIAQAVKAAARSGESDVRRKNELTWQSFSKGIRGTTPSVDDFAKFPALGA